MIYHFLVVKCQPWQIVRFLFHAAKTILMTWNIGWEIWLKMQKTSQPRKTSNAKPANFRISHACSHWYLSLSEKNKTLNWVGSFLATAWLTQTCIVSRHRYAVKEKCPLSPCSTKRLLKQMKDLLSKRLLSYSLTSTREKAGEIEI